MSKPSLPSDKNIMQMLINQDSEFINVPQKHKSPLEQQKWVTVPIQHRDSSMMENVQNQATTSGQGRVS